MFLINSRSVSKIKDDKVTTRKEPAEHDDIEFLWYLHTFLQLLFSFQLHRYFDYLYFNSPKFKDGE